MHEVRLLHFLLPGGSPPTRTSTVSFGDVMLLQG